VIVDFYYALHIGHCDIELLWL